MASVTHHEELPWLEGLVQCVLLDERLPWEEGSTRAFSQLPWLVHKLPGAPWNEPPPLSPMFIRALLSRLDVDADPVAAALHSMLNPDAATDGTRLALQWFHSRWLALKTWAVCSRGGDATSVQDFYGGGGDELPADWAIESSRIDEAAALQPADLETGAAVELGVTYVLPDGPDLLRVLPLTDGSVVYELTQVGPAAIEGEPLAERVLLPEPEQGGRAHTLLVAVEGASDIPSGPPDSHKVVVRNNNLRGLYGDTFCGTAQFLAHCAGRSSSRAFCTTAFSGSPAAAVRSVPRGVPAAPTGPTRSLATGALRMMRLVR